MEKIPFTPEGGSKIELYVIEQTTVGGVDYFLATESEEGDCDALILKDLSNKDDEEAVFEVVEDDAELNAIAKIFENLLDDISFVTDDSSDE